MTKPIILVLGATGKTGRRVSTRLVTAGHAVRAGSRSAVPRFDWEDPGTWPTAVAGVATIYLTYQPDLAFPGALLLRPRTEARLTRPRQRTFAGSCCCLAATRRARERSR